MDVNLFHVTVNRFGLNQQVPRNSPWHVADGVTVSHQNGHVPPGSRDLLGLRTIPSIHVRKWELNNEEEGERCRSDLAWSRPNTYKQPYLSYLPYLPYLGHMMSLTRNKALFR